MREIKFRLPFFNHKGGRFSHFDYWGAIDFRGKAILEHGSFSSPSQSSECSKGWHEQYTGLKDKNGKEIYEGDILKNLSIDYESDAQKAWEDSGFDGEQPAPTLESIDVCTLEHFRYWLKNESFGYEGEDLQSPDEWEIIGNIHENPELI